MINCYIMDTDANKNVGKHFKVKEFACKDGSQVVFIDSYLVSILDILRNQVGKPVYINSGYRTPTRNKAVGGAKYSYHMRGMAADIRVEGMTAIEIANKLKKSSRVDAVSSYTIHGYISTRAPKPTERGCKNGSYQYQRRQAGNQNHDADSGKAGRDLSRPARPAERRGVNKDDSKNMERQRPDRRSAESALRETI